MTKLTFLQYQEAERVRPLSLLRDEDENEVLRESESEDEEIELEITARQQVLSVLAGKVCSQKRTVY